MPAAVPAGGDPDGDLVGTGWVTGGSDRRPSTLEVQAAIDASTSALEAAERRSEELAAALAGAVAEQADRAEVAEQALAALHESDANMSAVYEQLGRLGHVVRAAHAESERLLAQRAKAESGREETLAALAELEERLRRAEDEQSGAAADSGSTAPTDFEREAAAAALTEVRAMEVEARLAVRTAEERAESVRGKADSLRRAAQAEREARARPSGRGRPVEPPPRWRPQWPRPGRRWPTVSTASWRTRWHTVTS
ncbi:hypothetical protein GS473_16370 [Rhodococcus hoagii]|nr:hypothetical protein [Prescottella equi]